WRPWRFEKRRVSAKLRSPGRPSGSGSPERSPRPLLLVVAQDRELGRQDRLVAPPGQRAPDEALGLAAAIHVGRVEEVHAQFEGALEPGFASPPGRALVRGGRG